LITIRVVVLALAVVGSDVMSSWATAQEGDGKKRSCGVDLNVSPERNQAM